MNENIFDKLDFGPFRALLDNDDITDISFDNNGQIWIRSLTQGSLRVEVNGATPEFVEKLAFQCSNVMGTTFNNAKPFLDAESSELRLNFVHPSIATNGIAMVIRKTPAKIRLEKEKLIAEEYFSQDIHDILIKCVEGHCNIIVAGETGSGKTEFVKYLASHTKTNEKIITIEDTLELHLDKIFPQRDIVAMKTNNVASYTDVLVTCMRQNPKWILLSEVRSAEAVTAVRNSISSGHNILSTIHADKASAIPYRLYSLMETDIDVNQFLSTIYRYIQLGVHIRAYYSKERGKFHREVDEVVEFYVDENNQPQSRIIYQKIFGKDPILRKPSNHLIEYLENQNIDINSITDKMVDENPFKEDEEDNENENYNEEYNVEQERSSEESEEVNENVESENETAEEENNSEVEVKEAEETEEKDESENNESAVMENSENPEEEESKEESEAEVETESGIMPTVDMEVAKEEQAEPEEQKEVEEENEELPTLNNLIQNVEPVAPQQAVQIPEIPLPIPTVEQQPQNVSVVPEVQQMPQQQNVIPSPIPQITPAVAKQPEVQQQNQALQQMTVQPMNNQVIPQPVIPPQMELPQQVANPQQQVMPQQMPQQQMGVPQGGILPFIPPTNGQLPPGVA